MDPDGAPIDDSQPPSASVTTLGRTLKQARVAHGYSLSKVAAGTGISKSLLSLVENDKSDISIRRLAVLAHYYGLHVTDLLPEKAPQDPVVTRRGERRMLHSATEGTDLHVLVPDTKRKMLPLVAVIAPGGGSAEYWAHEGEEFVVVLEGQVLLDIEGCTPVVLDRGDSAYYESTRRHRWRNMGQSMARVLSVSTPPTNL